MHSFFVVAELGSLSRAAERLRVSQSTLTRQMQSLEHELGGRLLERGHGGVALTAAGLHLLKGMKPVVASADAVIAGARKLARGQSGSLRIGYLVSAAAEYFNPALAQLRRAHPEIKVKLVDLSPGEQIAAMRRGELDVGVVGNVGASITREFFVKRIVSLSVVVALPEHHRLADRESIALADLRSEDFIGAHEEDIPGYNRWLVQLCRPAGYRPRLVDNADGLAHTLSMVVAENAVVLLPALSKWNPVPGVAFRPLQHATAKWDLLVIWQRGKSTAPVRALVAALSNRNGA